MNTRASRLPKDAIVIGSCVVAWLVYLCLGLSSHYQLRTSAFDLSVFDYAIWNTGTGGSLAFVPMFGFSLLAQHFMPTLLLLAPFGLLFHGPVYLIVLQSAFFATSGYLLYRFAAPRVPVTYAIALVTAYLLSRRTYSAATSYFYIESAEPLLVFGALLAWASRRRVWYWSLVILALGCKEDMTLYFALFGVLQAASNSGGPERTQGVLTVALCVIWAAVAVFVAIPYWSDAYGLGPSNPFFTGRFGIQDRSGISEAIARAFSIVSLAKIITVTSAVGFLCFLAPRWFAIALVGMLPNLAALPGSNQAGLVGHYLWPILPWLFVAAVYGAQRLGNRGRAWIPWVALIIAIADTPLPAAVVRAFHRDVNAATVLAQLRELDPSGTVVAQSNLIPHLSRQSRVFGYGVYSERQPEADVVLLTRTGDTWPLGANGVDRELSRWQSDVRYEQISAGPLWVFRRRN